MVEDEVVAVDLENGRYLGVNATGAALWPLLEVGTSREELVRRLVNLFDVDAARAHEDVVAWLAWLEEHALLEPLPDEPRA